MEINFSSENGQRFFIYNDHKFFIKPAKNHAGVWMYQLRVISLTPVHIRIFENAEQAINYVNSRMARLVYENKACKRYCDNVLNYQIIGNTMEISRIDYPVGQEYPTYAECAREAKKSIMQMIAPTGTVAKGATYDVN